MVGHSLRWPFKPPKVSASGGKFSRSPKQLTLISPAAQSVSHDHSSPSQKGGLLIVPKPRNGPVMWLCAASFPGSRLHFIQSLLAVN